MGLWIIGVVGLLFLMQRTWPPGIPMPDLRWTYTARDLNRWLALLDPGARRWFGLWHLTLDLLWPLVYGTLLLKGTRWLASRRPLVRGLPALVVLVVLSDLVENGALALYAWKVPRAPVALAWLAVRATTLKWTLLVLLVLGSLRALLQRSAPRSS